MRADEGLAARVVKVALHEEVEQVGCVTADGAELGVAALQDLIAEGSAHVGTALKKCAGELRGERRARYGGVLLWKPFSANTHTDTQTQAHTQTHTHT